MLGQQRRQPLQRLRCVVTRPQRRCPLCQHPVVLTARPDARCPACHSPLAALPGPEASALDLLGRRGAVRRDQSHVALLHVGWPSQAMAVRWRDLSLTGLSLYTPVPIAPVGPIAAIASPAGASMKEIVRQAQAELERGLIAAAIEETGGNVTRAAKRLQISRKSLQVKMKDLGLRGTEE